MEKRGRSEDRKRSSAEAQSSKGGDPDGSADSRESKKRGAHGSYSGAPDIPSFMQLSGEQAEQGRRSRSGSRSGSSSRSASPAGGVQAGSVALSAADVTAMAAAHLEGLLHSDPGAGEARVEDLAPYGGRCYWCLN